MLTFVSVQGPCVVAPDSSCQEPEEPYPGMVLPMDGEGYLVTTGDNANVGLTINGEPLQLGPGTVLKVRAGELPLEERLDRGVDNLKLFIGLVWKAMGGGQDFEQAVANAVIGVRG